MRTIIVFLCASVAFGAVVRIPGPGGEALGSTPPPPADITVAAFTRAAIVTAISQCTGAVGHRTIFFPQGTYPIASTIPLNGNSCVLFGVRAKSILDSTSCSGCYVFTGTNGNGANYTFQDLNLRGGGLSFDFLNGTTNINHVVFSNLSSQAGLNSPGGISGLTWDSNIMTGFSCPSPCSSSSPTGVILQTGISNSSFTNSYWDTLYQGFALGGGRALVDTGSNVTITGNTFQGIIRMPVEFTTPNSNSTISNNYASNFRTQTESASPNGTNNAVFTGQNPTQGCPNYPNGSNPRGTAPDATGFGNRYECNSFCYSMVGGGTNVTINNNYCQGLTNGSVSISWGIEVVVASGQVRNNVMLGAAFGISDDGQSSSASTSNNSNNIHCGIFNTNPASGQNGNIYNSSCIAAGIPSPSPVPNPPFNPVTGL